MAKKKKTKKSAATTGAKKRSKKSVKKTAKKTVKKSSSKKSTKKKAAKRQKPASIGDRISGAYHVVVDSITGTDALRNKLSKTGASESE